MFKKVGCLIVSLTIAFTALTVGASSSKSDYLVTVDNLSGSSYFEYSQKFSSEKLGTEELTLELSDYNQIVGEVSLKNENGILSLYTAENSLVEWCVKIPESGLYNLKITYKAADENRNEILRELRIDDSIPFDEAADLELSRVWENATEILQDSQGNDLYQEQKQVFISQTELFDDISGYYSDPFKFYFTEGLHKVSLLASQGSIEIENLSLCPPVELIEYDDYIKEKETSGLKAENLKEPIKIQAEEMTVKSSAMLSAVSDRSSPALEPAVGKSSKLNILGGGRFNANGQWVEYEINDIPKDGLYTLVFKAKQNSSKGVKVSRDIYVNGEIPFKEAKNFEFDYSTKYKNITLGDGENPYLVYLKKGSNTLRIEASLGSISEYCRRVSDSLEELNSIYRKIVTITGTSPDVYRDYDIKAKLPESLDVFKNQSEVLNKISIDMASEFKGNSNYTAIIDSMALLLERMYEDPYTIASNVPSLSSNLSSLGSLISDMRQTDLNMDYILVAGKDAAIPSAESSFIVKVIFEIEQLVYSFVADYNNYSTYSEEKSISAWIISGRDQSQILKQLIDSDFTQKNNIGVSLRLVSTVNTLLQATLAGVGPDVALNMPQSDIMNFAFRGAIVNLNEFEGIEEIKKRFVNGSLEPLTYKDSLYGLPQTCTYPMLFYRADILADLGLEVPQTWDDVYKIIPVLTQNHMSFGLATSDITNNSKQGVISYGTLLYQRGGSFYDEEGRISLFDTDLAIETMEDWSELYSGYGLPSNYNFANRFASGEMPLAVADYSAYNTLVVFAPQIENLWGLTQVPGTRREDETVDHSAPVTVTAGIILEDSDNKDKAYKFLQWWTSDEVQSLFGNFIESILGPSGRYATSNVNVLSQLPWNEMQIKNLKLQSQSCFGIPEIPGGYYTWRYLDNTFREIIDDSADVREVMYSCNKSINEEMTYQRQALGLE